MAEFRYKARDSFGKIRKGTVSSNSKEAARAQLKKMRLTLISIKTTKLDSGDGEQGGFLSSMFFKDDKGKLQIQLGSTNPSTKDIVVFTKQFAVMIKSGVPLVQAIDILSRQQRVRSFGKCLTRIRQAVETGSTLSDALEAFPKIFDTLYVAMIRAGEASGNLDVILMKLVVYIEKAEKIRNQVKSAMLYPIIVIAAAIIVVTVLLIFVVPTFAKQFEDAGKELPFLTQIVIDISNFLQKEWYILLGGIFASIMGINAWKKTENGRIQFDALLLKIPLIGELLLKIAVGRFCSTMATMLTSGVNLLDALTICASSSGNKTIESFVLNIRVGIENGQKFSEPLGEGSLFPPMVVSMVAVGESSGALDEMLVKVSEFYEDEVDLAVKAMISAIEPILIVGLGGVVGFILIAMYLPIFDLASLVG